jgi:hypothetical protein
MAKRFEDSNKGLLGMLYGQPGCGKTTLMATACKDERFGRVLDLDAFGNPQVLRKLPMDQRPDIVLMEKLEDFNQPFNWLKDGQDPKDPYAKELKLKPPYKTIFVDGTTEVQRFIVNIISGAMNLDPGKMVTSLGRQGFGQLLGTMMNWSKHFVQLSDLGLNVFFTCLEADKKDENQNSSFEPLIWGQSGLELCGYVLLVGRLTVRLRTDNDIRAEDAEAIKKSTFNTLQVLATKASYAKDQYGCGVTHINNPTMSSIMDLIERSS